MIASGSLDGTWDSMSPRYQREARTIYISRVFLIQAVCIGSHLLRNRWYSYVLLIPAAKTKDCISRVFLIQAVCIGSQF